MGYNSLGNIFFFGAGMYICAVVQIGLLLRRRRCTRRARAPRTSSSRTAQYFTGFALGIVAAGLMAAPCWPSCSAGSCSDCAAPISRSARSAWRSRRRADGLLGMGRRRQRHFHAGVPRRAGNAEAVFLFPAASPLPSCVLLFLRWLYSTNFGLAINAIRDDEEKAEAMGLHTARYKRTALVRSPRSSSASPARSSAT